VYRLGDMIQHLRSVFRHAHEAGLIPTPQRFGPGFNRPTKKTLRLHKAQRGPPLFSADEIPRLLAPPPPTLKAMILLGVNCAFGNGDCARLPLSAVDLDGAMIDFARPKTGIPRRCPLWAETVEALRVVIARRPTAKDEAHANRVFLTRCGF